MKYLQYIREFSKKKKKKTNFMGAFFLSKVVIDLHHCLHYHFQFLPFAALTYLRLYENLVLQLHYCGLVHSVDRHVKLC